MLEGQLRPLDVAKQVLDLSTLQAVAQSPFTRRGWAILDRWALNSPTQLRNLEKQGEMALLSRLLEQQNLEQRTLDLQAEVEMTAAMADHEILAMHQIETELK